MIGPRKMSSGAGTPDRPRFGSPRRPGSATKQLIDRFETLGTPSLPTPSAPGTTYRRCYFPPAPTAQQKRDKSPIRQSLRTFLTVLKKGTAGFGKRIVSPDKLSVPATSSTGQDGTATAPAPPAHRRTHSDASVLTTISTGKRKEGSSLLYLTRASNDPTSQEPTGPLQWTPCTVTLEPEERKLLVSTFGPELDLCIHEIILSKCTDIHSLSPNQLSDEDIALLRRVKDRDSLRIFELVFEGRVRERFAAMSVLERAGWISAIWDSILGEKHSYKVKDILEHPDEDKYTPHSNHSNNQAENPSVPLRSPVPLPLPKISPLLTPSYSERSLPPLPPEASGTPHLNHDARHFPTNSHILPGLHIPTQKVKRPELVSPSIYAGITPGRPAEFPSASRIARPAVTSPSVANLSSLSLVQQRLVQIERRHSELSARTLGSARTPGITPGRAGGWKDVVSASGPGTTPLTYSSSVVAATAPDFAGQQGTGSSFFPPQSQVQSRLQELHGVHGIAPLDDVSPGVAGEDRPVLVPENGAEVWRGGTHENSTKDATSRPRDDETNSNSQRAALATITTSLTSLNTNPNIDILSAELESLKNAIGGAPGAPSVHQIVVGLDHRVQGEAQTLTGIQHTLAGLGEEITHISTVAERLQLRVEGGGYPSPRDDSSANDDERAAFGKLDEVIGDVKEMREKLDAAFRSLFERFGELERSQAQAQLQVQQAQEQGYRQEGGEGKSGDVIGGDDSEVRDQPSPGSGSASSGGNGGHLGGIMTTLLGGVSLGGEPKGCASVNQSTSATSSRVLVPEADFSALNDRLSEIKDLCERNNGGQDEPSSSLGGFEQLDRIISLLDKGGEKNALLLHHQADSVRYLNELNGWLEAFVSNGTSHMQTLAANVDRLCKELGVGVTTDTGQDTTTADGDQGRSPLPYPGETTPTLLHDIRQLVIDMQARDQNFAALQAAVHGLLDVLAASQMERGNDSKALAGLIDQQSKDQRALFRAFTSEISEEIKGERLRFVEAMKEATAINVQLHVEQFKQELTKEVMNMTQEVGRLHQEKQAIETQISDLFTFHSRQIQNQVPGMPLQASPAANIAATPRGPIQLTRSPRRPLPYPKSAA